MRPIDKQFLLFVQNNRKAQVISTINSGANVQVNNNEALTIASICGYFGMLRTLHILGADLNNKYDLCMQLAKKYKHKDFLKKLEKYATENGIPNNNLQSLTLDAVMGEVENERRRGTLSNKILKKE